jgi:hypothetical protein
MYPGSLAPCLPDQEGANAELPRRACIGRLGAGERNHASVSTRSEAPPTHLAMVEGEILKSS